MNSIRKCLKNNWGLLIALLLIGWVIVVNRFPSGYIYASGDFVQPINMAKVMETMKYTWSTRIASPGEGGYYFWIAAAPFYFIFYFLPSFLGFSDTQVLSVLLFFFLLLSYFSFRKSLKVIFHSKSANANFLSLFPLLYVLNPLVWYFFSYTWGFSHHVILYISIPLLIAFYYRFLKSPSVYFGIRFLLMLFISAPGFTNSAFILSLFLYLFLLSLILFVIKEIKFSFKKLVLPLLLLFLCAVFLLAYLLFPLVFEVSSGMSAISHGMFDLFSWLDMQAADIISVFAFLPGYSAFYPFKYSLKVLYLLPYLPMLVVAVLLVNIRKIKESTVAKKLSLGFLVLFCFQVILLKKSFPPFGILTIMLFRLPLIAALRSYEKVAILFPFTLFLSIYGLFPTNEIKKFKVASLIGLLLYSFSTPFLLGGLQTKYTIAHTAEDNYESSVYSSLVKIPKDYYEMSDFVNGISDEGKLQGLPYNSVGSEAWVYFPKWKLRGFNPTEILFDKPTIAPSISNFSVYSWNPSHDLNSLNISSAWYPKFLSFLNVSHILFHKDVNNSFVLQALPRMFSMVDNNLLYKTKETENLILYSLNNDVLPSPHIYSARTSVEIYDSYEKIPYAMLLPDFPLNSVFRIVDGDMPLEKGDKYIVLDRNPERPDLVGLRWNAQWPFVSRSPYQMVIGRMLGKESEKSSAENWKELLDQKLLYLSSLGSLLATNPTLATKNFLEEYNEIKTILLENRNAPEIYNYFEKSYRYITFIRNEYSDEDTASMLTSVLKDFQKFYDTSDALECQGHCFVTEVPETGEYEIYSIGVSNPQVTVSAVKEGTEDVVLNSLGDIGENVTYFGKHYFNSADINKFVLNGDANESIVLDNGWSSYEGNLTADTEVAELISQGYLVFSKQLVNWDPSFEYLLSFSMPSEQPSNSYLLFVERPLEISNELSFDFDDYFGNKELFVNNHKDTHIATSTVSFKETAVGGTKDVSRRISPVFRVAKSPYIILITKDNPEFIVEKLKVVAFDHSKLILRKKGARTNFSSAPNISYDQVDSTKYVISVRGVSDAYDLIFSESYDKNWKLFLLDENGKKVQSIEPHFLANGFANGWKISEDISASAEGYTLLLEFFPQRVFIIGVIFSATFFFLCMGIYVFTVFRRHTNGKE